MIVVKTSNLNISQYSDNKQYQTDLDKDVASIFLCLQNRVRFGSGTTGANGENVSGQFVTVTSDATPNTEFTVAHTMGSVPVGFIVLWQDKAGQFFQGPATGTAWTSSNIYIKNTVASVNASIFLVK